MDARTIARVHSLGRVALGTGLVLAPGLVAGSWVGAPADRPGGQVIAVAMGARGVGLGLVMFRAAGRPRGVRPWLRAAILADAADLVATVRARDDLPAFALALLPGMAAGAVALGAWLDDDLDGRAPRGAARSGSGRAVEHQRPDDLERAREH